MEEDENTPKSLPRWVELEYMVRRAVLIFRILTDRSTRTAHAHACWSGGVRAFYTPLRVVIAHAQLVIRGKHGRI